MLPRSLHGPGNTIHSESPDTFLRQNRHAYPNLDPDFILQICFEQPDRFDSLLPGFDPTQHSAIRVEKALGWVYDNVRYDLNEELDFWYDQFDSFRMAGEAEYEIYTYMAKAGTWPFPPVIIEAEFAIALGASEQRIGRPYHLIEGTHRVSYARRMLLLDLLGRARSVELIEVKPSRVLRIGKESSATDRKR